MMELATRVLRASGSAVTEPSSIRDGTPPRIARVPAGRSSPRLWAMRSLAWIADEGRTAVIVPLSLRDPMARSLGDSLPRAPSVSATPPSTPA